jgi:kynurenine formamidase
MADPEKRFVDLSHVIEAGMTSYKGLPGPVVGDYWSRDASAALYDDDSTFHIGRIDMVANTGTYIDAPFHRYAGGADIAALDLAALAGLDGLVIDVPHADRISIESRDVIGQDVRDKAVLLRTGWDAHWRTDTYFSGHPFLTAEAARLLVQGGARLVGIDSHNIDDTRGRSRPVHSMLLGSGIIICEHLTNLSALPRTGFTFTAVPPMVAGMGSFPVRAFAEIPAG